MGCATDSSIGPFAGIMNFSRFWAIGEKAPPRSPCERGYRTRLLSAAFRNHMMHWSELIGSDVVISPPYSWQVRFNASDIAVRSRIDDPVDPKIVDELTKKFREFRRASEIDGLTPEEFDSFGATRRTLRQFIAACYDLNAIVRDFQIPNPDGA